MYDMEGEKYKKQPDPAWKRQKDGRKGTGKMLKRGQNDGNPAETVRAARPEIRTDLACEAGRRTARCVSVRTEIGEGGQSVTVTRSVETDGRRFVTVSCGAITAWSEEDLTPLASLIAREVRALAESVTGQRAGPGLRVLVAGLGNADMTPDALGPGTVRRMSVTRHLRAHDGALFAALGCCELSAVAPGVLGQTGIEAAELVRMAAETVRPHLIVAVDALAARSCERLSSTVQISDGGISPGAGIGNRRLPVDAASMGCPVLALGVPTVVDSSTLVMDALERAGITLSGDGAGDALADVLEKGRSFIVSPRDCDRMMTMSCILLARALDMAFGIESVV